MEAREMTTHCSTLAMMVAAWGVLTCVTARTNQAQPFETNACGVPSADAPVIAPWRTITLDAEYGGYWVVAGDVDGDGEIEVVSAKNYNRSDNHFTSSVVVQKLDGSILWQWGDPNLGRRELHHDVACQIHDLDNDGMNEVTGHGPRDVLLTTYKEGIYKAYLYRNTTTVPPSPKRPAGTGLNFTLY
jgi:hypothetical protein